MRRSWLLSVVTLKRRLGEGETLRRGAGPQQRADGARLRHGVAWGDRAVAASQQLGFAAVRTVQGGC
jgi:hypothetical protein